MSLDKLFKFLDCPKCKETTTYVHKYSHTFGAGKIRTHVELYECEKCHNIQKDYSSIGEEGK